MTAIVSGCGAGVVQLLTGDSIQPSSSRAIIAVSDTGTSRQRFYSSPNEQLFVLFESEHERQKSGRKCYVGVPAIVDAGANCQQFLPSVSGDRIFDRYTLYSQRSRCSQRLIIASLRGQDLSLSKNQFANEYFNYQNRTVPFVGCLARLHSKTNGW